MVFSLSSNPLIGHGAATFQTNVRRLPVRLMTLYVGSLPLVTWRTTLTRHAQVRSSLLSGGKRSAGIRQAVARW